MSIFKISHHEISGFAKDQKIPYYVVFISFSLWLVFLILLAFRQLDINGIESTDSYFYLKLAESSFKKQAYTHKVYSPGYSWIISLLLNFGFDLELAGRIVSILFSFLSVIVAFLSMRIFFGDSVAFFGTLSFMFIPQYIYYSVSTLPYTTATFFFWIVFYLSFSSKKNILLSFLSGLLCGYGYVVRPENILGLFLHFVLTRSFISFLFLLLGFFVSSLPYHVLSMQENNIPSILSKFISYYVVPGVQLAPQEALEKAEQISRTAFEFKHYINHLFSNLHLSHKYAIPNLISPISLVFWGLGLGAVLSYWKVLKDGMKPFFWLFIVWVLPIFLVVIVADYMFVQTLITFGAICGNSLRLFNLRKIIFIIIPLISLNAFWAARPFYSDDGKKIYKIAGYWIKQNIGPHKTIFENSPFSSFYADGIWTVFSKNAEIIVITSVDFVYPRNQHLVGLFLSDGNDEFELVQKIKYKNIIAKIFRAKMKKE